MSRFMSQKFEKLVPYTPGEQPQDKKYIKLNTNESPFPPSDKALASVSGILNRLMRYPDPECSVLDEKFAKTVGVAKDEVMAVNGSDEILNFAFAAFCDKQKEAVFPDITYGFYEVFADYNGVPYRKIPLGENFRVNPADYFHANATVFLANPNAPTGIALTLNEVEAIVKNNPENIVVIDEAYVDFGGESAVSLIHTYDNLLVTQTFSKSRSAAGARLGFGIACKSLIADLNTVRFSTNPYNINAMTMALGEGILDDEGYTRQNCKQIIALRTSVQSQFKQLGFETTDSSANFIFAKHPAVSGETMYQKLKEKGILVRHFNGERIKDFNRITVGTKDEMAVLMEKIKEILEEETA